MTRGSSSSKERTYGIGWLGYSTSNSSLDSITGIEPHSSASEILYVSTLPPPACVQVACVNGAGGGGWKCENVGVSDVNTTRHQKHMSYSLQTYITYTRAMLVCLVST